MTKNYVRNEKLTERQKQFCIHYAATGNGIEAAKKAGYSSKSAKQAYQKVIDKPSVINRINEERQKLAKDVKVNYDVIIDKLSKVTEFGIPNDLTNELYRSNTDQPLTESDLLILNAQIKGIQVALSAISEINKMEGNYAAEKRVNTNVNLQLDEDIKTLAEVHARIKKRDYEL